MIATRTTPARTERLALCALVVSGLLWGMTWIPLKHFAAEGLSGLGMTVLSYGVVGLLALPLIWRERMAWKPQSTLLITAALTGGAANVCFVSGLMLGDVVHVMLMFYLAPVWGVVGGRLFLGETITALRLASVGMAVVGAAIVLGGPSLVSVPVSLADMLGLGAGFLYAAQNIAFRAAHRVPVLSKALAVFTGCAIVSAVLFPLTGGSFPVVTPGLVIQTTAFAGIWMMAAMWTTMYGVTHLEAGRAAVLLVFELVAAVSSAMLIAGERLTALEWVGAALITAAALLEARSSPSGERIAA